MSDGRAPRNRTLTLTADEERRYAAGLLRLDGPSEVAELMDEVVHQAVEDVLPHLPRGFVDLMIIDPPYNLTKQYASSTFHQLDAAAYVAWMRGWFDGLMGLLKPTATVYVCADWRTSSLVYPILGDYLTVRNRITWEREKGRGARRNWKNASEDIWFATVGDNYTFHVDRVKLKRRVRAPYRTVKGRPKDWVETTRGKFRLTHPSNLWTDISVPFWSMPENTEHPTQKPEKLVAKLVLASSNPGDVVFDPFAGSGTTAVVAKKLGRRFVAVEREQRYCALAAKRLELAATDTRIQGYEDGVFWERNSR
ncbi:MAG: site-specific DNA-methyltransferase [Chloroflexota bacterium]